MVAVKIQELSHSRSLLGSIAEQNTPVTLSFFSLLKNGTNWMLKSEIYHLLLDSKNHF